jgi:hypothetical protein
LPLFRRAFFKATKVGSGSITGRRGWAARQSVAKVQRSLHWWQPLRPESAARCQLRTYDYDLKIRISLSKVATLTENAEKADKNALINSLR